MDIVGIIMILAMGYFAGYGFAAWQDDREEQHKEIYKEADHHGN